MKGPEESRGGLSLARYCRESRTETVFGIFLPRLLLFIEHEPESDAPGTVVWSFPMIQTADVFVCG